MRQPLRPVLALGLGLALTACSGDKAPTFATVEIDNANAATVQVFGCPDCTSKGAGIPGVPRGAGGGYNVFGWDVDKAGPLSYTVSIHGRRTSCRQPTPMPSRGPAQPTTYHLTYRITRSGHCVVSSQGYYVP